MASITPNIFNIDNTEENRDIIKKLNKLYQTKLIKYDCVYIDMIIAESYTEIPFKLTDIIDNKEYTLLYLIWLYIKVIFILKNANTSVTCDSSIYTNYIQPIINKQTKNCIVDKIKDVKIYKEAEQTSAEFRTTNPFLENIITFLNKLQKDSKIEIEIEEIEILKQIITKLKITENTIQSNICNFKKKYDVNIRSFLQSPINTTDRDRSLSEPPPAPLSIFNRVIRRSNSGPSGGKKKSRRYKTKKTEKEERDGFRNIFY